MDPLDGQMRQMLALDAIGGALAADTAVTGSPVNDHVFSLYVPEARVRAHESVDGGRRPYQLTTSEATVRREFLAMREAETEKWDGVVLHLDKANSGVRLDFLYGEDAERIAPTAEGHEPILNDTHGTPVWVLALIALVVIGVVIYGFVTWW